MDVKFISQDNEVQKLYAKFGMVVPVGDLSTGKAPAIQPLPSTSTQTSVTAQFNVMSGADISALSYTVNDGEAVSITPAKGVVTITLTDLEYNSGPYEIEITAVNENGSTSASVDTDLVHYTNWATANEVLLGNKYIGEDGQEHTGEYECPTCPEPVLETVPVTPTTSAQTITPSTGYDGIGTANVAAVTSSIDANIQAGNIKKDVEILGVTGTFEGGPSNYLELQLGDPSPWEDAWQNKYPFGGYLTLNLNDLTIPEGGTYSGNTPQDWVADMEFLQCYLDEQHSDFFMVDCTSYNGMLNAPRSLGNAFITSDGTVIIPCIAGSYEFDPDTGDQTIPNYDQVPCGQTNLTGDFEVYAVTSLDAAMTPMYEVVATGTYFIPATQVCE